jgi:hypothetical protein
MTPTHLALIALAVIGIVFTQQFDRNCDDHPARTIASVIIIGGCQR